MKVTEQPSKFVGVMVGEVALNFIRQDLPSVKIKLALLTEEGPAGYSDIGASALSEKTIKAMQALVESLEDDGLALLFKVKATQDTETTPGEGSNTPPQF